MMRLRGAVAVVAVALGVLNGQAQSLYVTEPFSVSPGNLAGQGSGAGWAGSWSADNGVFTATPGTGQTYSSLLTSGNSVTSNSTTGIYSRTISASASPVGNNFWVSFLLQTNAGANQYAGLDLGGNLYIGKASTDATYGIATTGNPADNVSHPTGPSVTSADLLVAHFRPTGPTSGAIDLYVNPTSLGGAAPGSGFVTANLNTAIPDLAGTIVRMFNGSLSGGVPTSVFSDIRIGDSFAAVTPVPEPLTVGLVGATGLGLVRLRRRFV